MPYVGNVYVLPPGSTATPNTTIESAPYNTLINDLATAQNTPRPVLGGGTGGDTAIDGNDGLNTKGAAIPSGSTTDLSAATGVYLDITGTTTINSFGTVPAGAIRQTTFTGILTLTYNVTSMILPGAANMTTAVGDTATFRSLGGGNWRCVEYLRASGQSPTNVIVSPNITGATTITSTAPGALLTVTSTDASASGLVLDLFKDSASPAINDFVAQLLLNGRNSAATKIPYASLTAQILDPTAASEDALAYIATYVAGVNAARLLVGAGAYMAGATGGDKGSGTFNATAIYANGTQIPFSRAFESTQQTITSGGALTLAHGLGVQPKNYLGFLICTTAQLGYSISDEVPTSIGTTQDSGTDRGVSVVPDATNFTLRYGSDGGSFMVVRKDTGVRAQITNSSWKFVIRAWA